MKQKGQKGFTIIELMISTVIFSLVLLGASAGIIQIGKKYSKGITYARTQEVARSTVDEIAQSLQFTSQSIKAPNYDVDGNGVLESSYDIYNLLYPNQISSKSEVNLSDANTKPSVADTFYFCIGASRYSFVLNKKIETSDDHAFWVDEPEVGCANAVTMAAAAMGQTNPSDSTYPARNGRELLDINMRITNLSISTKNNGLWIINLSVATGDSDLLLFTNGRVTCEGSILSSEFCATSEISSNVSKRIQ
jgi:prepilin-type N-terminal cleavage/methylation domain-containing protein